MSDADDPAQRYLALWTQYLTALLADPGAMETLKRWVSFTQEFSYPAPGSAQRNEAPVPLWPPFFGPFGMAAAPGTATEGGEAVAALARRIDELERRLAALERKPGAARPRRLDRGAQKR